jgi:8-oxo-dGTP diphosphatase
MHLMLTESEEAGRLQIAVGVILDARRRQVLIARRPDQARHGGMWEFPGGKQEPGESVEDALRRELLEELDLHVLAARPLMRVSHEYADLRVQLHVWVVDKWLGEPRGMQGQQHEWVPVSALHKREFPEANLRIITALQLPELYLITPDLTSYGTEFFAITGSLLAVGVKLLQFRSYRLAARERPEVLRRLSALCRESGARLVINGNPAEARAYGAHGVHLSATELMGLRERPLPRSFLVGASCHSAEELQQAERINADFAVLGPVARTQTHSGLTPLGWSGFQGLVRSMGQVPVYALGGLGPRDLSTARQAGAWGVAMISAIWSAPDPAAAIRAGFGAEFEIPK